MNMAKIVRGAFTLLLIGGLVAAGGLSLALHMSRASAALGTCTITFTAGGASNDWSNGLNWSPSRIPNSTDYACVPSTIASVSVSTGTNIVKGVNSQGGTFFLGGGSLELTDGTQTSQITKLNMTGGTMTVDSGDSLALIGAATMTGGTLTGAGTTSVGAGQSVQFGGITIRGGHTFSNSGAATWPTGTLCLGEGAVFDNNNGATFAAQADGYSISNCVGGPTAPRFHNLAGGTFTKTGAAGQTTYVSVPFDNDGVVQGNSANLQLSGGNSSGGSDSGNLQIASNATVEINTSTRTFSGSASSSGAGSLLLDGGTIQGNLAIGAGATAGTVNFSSGAFTGSGTLTINSGSTFNATGGYIRGGYTVVNSGTINWSSSSFCIGEAATVNNANGGTFNAQAGAGSSLSNCVGGLNGVFHNQAGSSFIRNGAATTLNSIASSVSFDNAGTVSVTGGLLEIDAPNGSGASDTGAYSIASGSTLTFSQSTRTLGSTATVSGAGTLSIAGGTTNFNGNSIPNLALSSGTTQGGFAVTSTFAVSGGNLSDAVGTPTTTTINAGATMTLTGGALRGGHTLANSGTANWTSGSFCITEGAVLTNGATFNANADGNLIYNCGSGSARFHNLAGGTLRRTGASGTNANVSVPFDNDGMVQGTSANLQLSGGSSPGASDGGGISVAANASVEINTNTRTFGGGTETGAGLLLLDGGTIQGNITVGSTTVPGTVNLSSGTLTGSGTTTIAPMGVLNYTGGYLRGGYTLANNGTINWTSGGWCIGEAAILNNLNGGNVNLKADGNTMSNCVGGTAGRFHNVAGGTVTRSGASGTIVYLANSINFDNDGTVVDSSGTLEVDANSSGTGDTGSYSIASGTIVSFTQGTRTLAAAATVSGAGTLSLSGGTTTLSGNSIPNLALSGGTTLGPYTITGTFNWSGGNMSDPVGSPATTTIASTATETFTAGYLRGGHTELNNGTINWMAGSYCVGEAANLNNAANFNAMADGQSMTNCVGGTTGRFHNLAGGTITRTGAAGQTNYLSLPTDNDGTIQATSANLQLSGGNSGTATDSGSISIASGATVELNSSTRSFSGAASESGAGTLLLDGATIQGTLSIAGTANFSGGAFTGSGTTTITSTGRINYSGGYLRGGYTLTNNGTIAWNSGSFCIGEGANLNNGGTFTATADNQSISNCVGGANGRFHNLASGTFTRTGAPGVIAYIGAGVPVDNDGTLQVTAGNLEIDSSNSAGATDGGIYNVASGSTLYFSQGSRTLASGSLVSGAGTLNLNGGTTTFTSNSIPNLAISGGTTNGPFVVTGNLNFSAGNMSDAVGTPTTSTIASSATVASTGGYVRGNHTLQNNGTINWTAGSFCLSEGAVLNNAGTFNANADNQSISNCAGGTAPQFTNTSTGTFNRNGVSTSYIGVPFVNNGMLSLNSGALNIQGSYAQPAGATYRTVISGTPPGTGFGQLQINATGTLGGNMVMQTGGGFTPTAGQSFAVVTCTTCTGSFSNVSGGSYGVTYTSGSVTVVALPNVYGPVSNTQYQLSNSDGSTWQTIDSTNLRQAFAPTVNSIAIVSGNADLFTATAGVNQDIGIAISGGAFPTAAGQPEVWKESGGFAGTYSPNAAYVQTVVNLNAGTTYNFSLVWKANKNAPGSTIYAAAGSGTYSPTRLTIQVIPATAASVTDKVSTLQYTLTGNNGSIWADMDTANLSTTITPTADSVALLGANADLFTANAGYNQDIAITVNGTVVAWKESGGFAGTFSPNAAFVQARVAMTHGVAYTIKLQWKANKADAGSIWAGAGPINGHFSPTRLTAELLPSGSNPYSAVSTAQYTLSNSDGTTWQDVDGTNLALTFTPSSSCQAIVTANSDLFTSTAGFNQDIGINVNGVVVAWKESGGFAGTFSPNAAYAQAVINVNSGTPYTFKVQWKTNKSGTSTIYAGAGPISGQFSPTSLSVKLVGC